MKRNYLIDHFAVVDFNCPLDKGFTRMLCL